jgi:CheY-like chemotaxis protein
MSLELIVVDDDHDTLALMGELLADLGHRVRGCTGARAAIEMCAHGGVDAAIVDIGMPGMDGYAACRALRRNDPELIVVLLTAHPLALATAAAADAGAFMLLQKPVGLDDLKMALGAIAQRRADQAADDGRTASSSLLQD